MNLVKATPKEMVFLLSAAEKQAWTDLLSLYPLQNSAVQPPGQSNAADAPLLEEALAAHRSRTRVELEKSLAKGKLFVPAEGLFQLTLSSPQAETMLQALNDLRVGSWHALGCPDQIARRQISPSAPEFRHLWVMELAGHFQMALLEACNTLRE